jgi:hypothetical protein
MLLEPVKTLLWIYAMSLGELYQMFRKQISAIIVRGQPVKEELFVECFTFECESSNFLRNAGNHSKKGTVSQSVRHESQKKFNPLKA